MLVEKNLISLLYLGEKNRRKTRANARGNAFHHAIHAQYNERRTGKKTRNMIALLLAHGTRATRVVQPKLRIQMNVFTPSGARAVKLRMSK